MTCFDGLSQGGSDFFVGAWEEAVAAAIHSGRHATHRRLAAQSGSSAPATMAPEKSRIAGLQDRERARMFSFMPLKIRCLLMALLCSCAGRVWSAEEPVVFPGKVWQRCPAHDVGLAGSRLDSFIRNVGGDGCIVKDGCLIRAWGGYKTHADWASATKPVLGTLLMLAIADKRLSGVDVPVRTMGWELRGKDSGITFRHLADMVSGYARAEPPGAAWAYNDVAVNLYARSLQRLHGTSLEEAFSRRLAELQFEDGAFFSSGKDLRVTASPRDFARLGWLWLNRGVWQGRAVIPREVFDACVRPGVPAGLPRSSAGGDDYLPVGSFGGDTDQTEHGPGVYGFNFWFNEPLPGSGHLVWPSLPPDAFQANGMWNLHTVTVIPSWGMVVALRDSRLGAFEPGRAASAADRKFSLLRPAHNTLLHGPQKR